MKKCGAIILAAGKGTRMKSNRAKVTFSLAEKPLIQRVVDVAESVSCETIAVVVGYKKEEAMSSLEKNDKLVFVDQKEQKGTGHAVMVSENCFRDFDGDIFILCGDVPLLTKTTLQKLIETHRKDKAACTVLTVKLHDPGSYGRIIRKSDGSVSKIVEYKDASADERLVDEINSGIYCFDAQSLFYALRYVNCDNRQREYYLTDTVEILSGKGKKVSAMITDNVTEVSGINSRYQLAELENQFYKRIKEYWLKNGVTIENPETVIIGEDVELDTDVHISPNCIIKGKSNIAKFAYIGPNSVIDNSILGVGVIIDGFNVLTNATVKDRQQLGWGEKKINGK